MAKRRITKSAGTANRAVRRTSRTSSSGVADLVALGTAARSAARTSSGSAPSATKSSGKMSKATKSGGANGRGTRSRKGPTTPAKVVEVEASNSSAPLQQRIAERAYAIWEARGGNDHLNWLEAERQIHSEAATARPRGRG